MIWLAVVFGTASGWMWAADMRVTAISALVTAVLASFTAAVQELDL